MPSHPEIRTGECDGCDTPTAWTVTVDDETGDEEKVTDPSCGWCPPE